MKYQNTFQIIFCLWYSILNITQFLTYYFLSKSQVDIMILLLHPVVKLKTSSTIQKYAPLVNSKPEPQHYPKMVARQDPKINNAVDKRRA